MTVKSSPFLAGGGRMSYNTFRESRWYLLGMEAIASQHLSFHVFFIELYFFLADLF